MRSKLTALLVPLAFPLAAFAQAPLGAADAASPVVWDEAANGPLPRNRPDVPPVDPNQSLFAVTVETGGIASAPNGLIASPPEYSATRGVLYRYSSGAWPTVVRDCVAELTAPGYDEIAYVVVGSAGEQSSAVSSFTAAGADMSRVQFIMKPTESIWLRDYGPHFIWQDGTQAIADSHYYPGRPNDNFIPTNITDQNNLRMGVYPVDLYYSGGNFQPGPNRTGFLTNLINVDNPDKTTTFIGELYQKYQGIDTLHIFPRLPGTVDATGHIDMWMYLIDPDSVIISQFIAGSNSTAISIANNAVTTMQGMGYTVHRPPAWNSGGVHYTYANAYRVNDRIFIPSYGTAYGAGSSSYNDEDAAALAIWQAAAPGVTIVPIACYQIIPAAGAIHCIVMQVPRYLDELPAGVVVSPRDDELLISGQTHTIRWNATDNETITGIGLYYSLDDGANWTLITNTTNTGSYNWTVPAGATDLARLKVVVTDNDTNAVEALSAQPFSIQPGTVNSYTFASGGGVDKFGRGTQTTSWSVVNATRLPVATAFTATDYSRLTTSNATGGETDANRYIGPIPLASSEATTVYEFTLTEAAADIGQIEINWEGFANDCTNIELYIWDDVQSRWGDATGLINENRSMDCYAGMRDGTLRGLVLSDFDRYLTVDNKLTILIYTDRAAKRTVHDFVAVKVSVVDVPDPLTPGDTNCDGSVNFFDIDPFLLALFQPGIYAATYPDCDILSADMNADDVVDFFDIDAFVACVFGSCP